MTPLTLAEIAILGFAYMAGVNHQLLQLGRPENDRDVAIYTYVATTSGGPRAVVATAIALAVATFLYDLA